MPVFESENCGADAPPRQAMSVIVSQHGEEDKISLAISGAVWLMNQAAGYFCLMLDAAIDRGMGWLLFWMQISHG